MTFQKDVIPLSNIIGYWNANWIFESFDVSFCPRNPFYQL